MRQTGRFIVAFVLSVVAVIIFQNCGSGGFDGEVTLRKKYVASSEASDFPELPADTKSLVITLGKIKSDACSQPDAKIIYTVMGGGPTVRGCESYTFTTADSRNGSTYLCDSDAKFVSLTNWSYNADTDTFTYTKNLKDSSIPGNYAVHFKSSDNTIYRTMGYIISNPGQDPNICSLLPAPTTSPTPSPTPTTSAPAPAPTGTGSTPAPTPTPTGTTYTERSYCSGNYLVTLRCNIYESPGPAWALVSAGCWQKYEASPSCYVEQP